jgi:hypothetical protein
MGWAKRTDGIAHARKLYEGALSALQELAEAEHTSKRRTLVIPELIDQYLVGCRMTGRNADDDLIDVCFARLAEGCPKLTWKIC